MIDTHAVTAVLESGVAERVFPGAVLHVRHRGSLPWTQAVGRLTYAGDTPLVTPDTIYDLASLTKPLATATLLLHLCEQGALTRGDRVDAWLPELAAAPVGSATIEQLLAHAAGLPAWRPYYERLAQEPDASGLRLEREQARERVLAWIASEPLERPVGTASVYSDLGFMLLGWLVERVAGRTLADTFRAWRHTHGLEGPLDFLDGLSVPDVMRGSDVRVAPTEQDPWRGRLLCGEVHDDNAWALGGVAGHAGLFGTAEAVGLMAQWWLDRVTAPIGSSGSSNTSRCFVTRVASIPGTSRALGWDTPSPPSSSGQHFPPGAFGHLGFTGTSVWVDPMSHLIVVLLSNRVHPTRANDSIKSFRPRIHDAVWHAWQAVDRGSV